MEKYVTSLEISKKLETAGFGGQSDLSWVCDNPMAGHFGSSGVYHYNPRWRVEQTIKTAYAYGVSPEITWLCTAYAFEQILNELPDDICVRGSIYYLEIYRDYIGYVTKHYNGCIAKSTKVETNPADAAAELWLYLKENNLLQK